MCLPFFVLYCPEQRIKLWRASRNITWNRPELVPGEPGTNSRRFHVMRVLMYVLRGPPRETGGGMIITHPNNPLYRERRRRCQSWDLRRLSRETPPHSYRRTPAFIFWARWESGIPAWLTPLPPTLVGAGFNGVLFGIWVNFNM